uniref:Uncharacterized protein n=1 Tax=Otarine gammaherpesvirus 4 TaxID=2801541 RepID=A0A889IW80_9GAMA|nr:hypothetical protein [Otarine gammaherpesvirus 4]
MTTSTTATDQLNCSNYHHWDSFVMMKLAARFNTPPTRTSTPQPPQPMPRQRVPKPSAVNSTQQLNSQIDEKAASGTLQPQHCNTGLQPPPGNQPHQELLHTVATGHTETQEPSYTQRQKEQLNALQGLESLELELPQPSSQHLLELRPNVFTRDRVSTLHGTWHPRRNTYCGASDKRKGAIYKKWWWVTLYGTYIKVTNRRPISLTVKDEELQVGASITELLCSQLPNFQFYNDAFIGRILHLQLFAYGHQLNPVKLQPFFIEDVNGGMCFTISHPRTVILDPGSLTFFVAALVRVRLFGLYLECRRDKKHINMTVANCQEAYGLDTAEPRVVVAGTAQRGGKLAKLCILTHKTRPLNKRYAHVESLTSRQCSVNSIRRGKHHLRLSLTPQILQGERITVQLTPLNDAVVAFRYSPFTYTLWDGKFRETVPIVYVGEPITVPALCSTTVVYNNSYSITPGSNLTALILQDTDTPPQLQIMECEWSPGNTVRLHVVNTSSHSMEVQTGTKLGEASFIIVNKYPIGELLPRACIDSLPGALLLPGNVVINAKKLTKLRLLSHMLVHRMFI